MKLTDFVKLESEDKIISPRRLYERYRRENPHFLTSIHLTSPFHIFIVRDKELACEAVNESLHNVDYEVLSNKNFTTVNLNFSGMTRVAWNYQKKGLEKRQKKFKIWMTKIKTILNVPNRLKYKPMLGVLNAFSYQGTL